MTTPETYDAQFSQADDQNETPKPSFIRREIPATPKAPVVTDGITTAQKVGERSWTVDADDAKVEISSSKWENYGKSRLYVYYRKNRGMKVEVGYINLQTGEVVENKKAPYFMAEAIEVLLTVNGINPIEATEEAFRSHNQE